MFQVCRFNGNDLVQHRPIHFVPKDYSVFVEVHRQHVLRTAVYVDKNTLFDSSLKIKAFAVYNPRKAADDMDNPMAPIGWAELEMESTVR